MLHRGYIEELLNDEERWERAINSLIERRDEAFAMLMDLGCEYLGPEWVVNYDYHINDLRSAYYHDADLTPVEERLVEYADEFVTASLLLEIEASVFS